MENERITAMIPYFAHEGMIDRLDRINRRLLVALIVVIVAFFLSNAAWLYCWMQYDYCSDETVTTVDSEGDGVANYTGGNGGVIYGTGDSPQDYTEPDAPER